MVIPETALTIAGPGAVLVTRGTGVAHVYTGPLTPSGQYTPRSGRTVCRVRTRQLRVIPPAERRSSLDDHAAALPRMCARCTACLARARDRARQVTSSTPRSREQQRQLHAETTKADVAFALELATTPAEVDAAAWVSLLLFGVAGTRVPFTEHDRDYPALHDLVCRARARVGGYPDAPIQERADRSAAATAQRAAERRQMHADREERIARLGMNVAEPVGRRARRRH